MDINSLPCPECATTLRFKNRTYINRNFPCPECETLLVVSYNLQQKLEIHQVDRQQETRDTDNLTSPKQTVLATCLALLSNIVSLIDKSLRKLTASPVAIAWLAASFCAAAVCLAVWMKSAPTRHTPIEQTHIEQQHKKLQPESTTINPPEESPQQPANVEEPPQQPVNLPPAAVQLKQHPAPVVALIPLPAPVVARKPEQNALLVNTSQIETQPVNVEELLAQKFVKYSQNRPLQVRGFLEQFEELSGLKVQVDETVTALENDPLDRSVTFELDNATLGQLLTYVLEKAGLMFKVDKESIRIILLQK